jgi:hypothetical protein
MLANAYDREGLPRSDPQVSLAFTVVIADKPEMPKLAAFAHYRIDESATTGSTVGDITLALSEANPKTLQFRLKSGHQLEDGMDAFTIDACGGLIGYKMGAEFSFQSMYIIEVVVGLRTAPPPTIAYDGAGNAVITTVGTTSMFIHVEITDGETEPLFNGKGASSLVGRIKESSVCVADGGRIPGCPCDSDSLCMTKCYC